MVGLGNDVAVFDDIALVVFGSGGQFGSNEGLQGIGQNSDGYLVVAAFLTVTGNISCLEQVFLFFLVGVSFAIEGNDEVGIDRKHVATDTHVVAVAMVVLLVGTVAAGVVFLSAYLVLKKLRMIVM